jgi:hypothetical protein
VPADGGESYAGSGDCESGAVSKCERAGRLDERAWGRGDWSAMIPFLAIFSFLGVLEERGSSRSGAMRAWISYLDEVLACVLVCFAWLMRCGAVQCDAVRCESHLSGVCPSISSSSRLTLDRTIPTCC